MFLSRDIISLIVIFVVLIGLFFIFVDKRPFTDEGSYCTVAQAISSKLVLYKDIYNEKSPLPYFIATPFVKGDNPIRNLRILVLVFNILSVLLFYLLLKKNSLSTIKAFFISLFYVLTSPLFQSFNYISETVALPMILFILFIIERDQTDLLNFLAGFFCILLIFVKQQFAIFSLVTFFYAIASNNIRPKYLYGVLLSIISIFLMLLSTGTLIPFFENIIFTFNRYDIRLYSRLPYSIEYYQFVLMLLFSVLLIFELMKKRLSFYRFMTVLSLLFPGIIRMDAFKLLPFFTLTLIFVSSIKYVRNIQNMSIMFLFLSLISVYQYRVILNQTFDGIKAVSYYIQSVVAPDETIWVAPHEANIYCLSHRGPASKYYFLLSWIARPEVIQRISEDLTRDDPPRCIVDVSQFNSASSTGLQSILFEFESLVKNYNDIVVINDAKIYCNKQ